MGRLGLVAGGLGHRGREIGGRKERRQERRKERRAKREGLIIWMSCQHLMVILITFDYFNSFSHDRC